MRVGATCCLRLGVTSRCLAPRAVLQGALPDLMFPADRSWLVSTLWDDDRTCVGGVPGIGGRVPTPSRSWTSHPPSCTVRGGRDPTGACTAVTGGPSALTPNGSWVLARPSRLARPWRHSRRPEWASKSAGGRRTLTGRRVEGYTEGHATPAGADSRSLLGQLGANPRDGARRSILPTVGTTVYAEP